MMTVMNVNYLQSKPERLALDPKREQSLVFVRTCKIRKRRITV